MRLLLLGQLSIAWAQDDLADWAGWTDWSACENEVYNRIRRCYTENDRGIGVKSNIVRLENGACPGHHQVFYYFFFGLHFFIVL